MTERTTPRSAPADQRLARAIAALMRAGTAVASALLAAGTILGSMREGVGAAILLTGGCALLIVLPVIRLAMMAGHFARLADTRYLLITIAVLTLVSAGGVTGLAV